MRGEITYSIEPSDGGAVLRHEEWMHAVGWLRPLDVLLGRMLALAGYPLGIDCTLLDTSPDAPGARPPRPPTCTASCWIG